MKDVNGERVINYRGQMVASHIVQPIVDEVLEKTIFKKHNFKNVLSSFSSDDKKFIIENGKIVLGAAVVASGSHLVEKGSIDGKDVKVFVKAAGVQVGHDTLDKYIIKPVLKDACGDHYVAQAILQLGVSCVVINGLVSVANSVL